jgi:hypothetical protein
MACCCDSAFAFASLAEPATLRSPSRDIANAKGLFYLDDIIYGRYRPRRRYEQSAEECSLEIGLLYERHAIFTSYLQSGVSLQICTAESGNYIIPSFMYLHWHPQIL